jgi:hypothetical protein
MLSIFQLVAFPGTLLTGLVAGGAIAVTARRYSVRSSHLSHFVGGKDKAPFLFDRAGIRGGRVPLPESVANLTPNDEPALLSVDAFVDRLAELTLDQWLDVGHRLVTNQETLALRSTSWAIMDATIADRRLGLVAWQARDAVETMAYLASAAAPRLSRRERRLFAAAHAAAEDAALAVLAREHLPREDFAVLCAPFDSTAKFKFSSRRC